MNYPANKAWAHGSAELAEGDLVGVGRHRLSSQEDRNSTVIGFPPFSLASGAVSDTWLFQGFGLNFLLFRHLENPTPTIPDSRKLAQAQQSQERVTSIVNRCEASFVISALPAKVPDQT